MTMNPAALRKPLATEAGRSVRHWSDGSGESTGQVDRTADDDAHMRKVVGYVRRHLAQGGAPRKEPDSAWRMSRMHGVHDRFED